MLNIFGHKGNANKNYIAIPFHPSQKSYHQHHKQQQMLARMLGKRKISTLLVECKICETLMESNRRSLKILKIQLPYDPVITLLGIYLKECAAG
jgi:hypothetical protein